MTRISSRYTVLVRMRCLKLHVYCFETMEIHIWGNT